MYDLPASSNRASGLVISTGPSSSTSSAFLLVYFTSTWPIFGSPRCILGRCCVKSQRPGCYTHQHQQNSGDNVAGFWIAFKNLQNVALKIALCTMLHEATFKVSLKQNFRMWDFCLTIKLEPYLETLPSFFLHEVSENCFWPVELKIGGHLSTAKTTLWRHWLY